MLRKSWYGVPVLVFVLVAILGFGAIAYAATQFVFHGTVNITGTNPPPQATYDFKVTTDEAGNVPVTDSCWSLGDMAPGASVTKTLWLTKTGTADSVDVAISATNVGAGVGVDPSNAQTTLLVQPVQLNVTVTIANGAAPGSQGFDINFARVQ